MACDSTTWGNLTEAGKPGELAAGRHWETPHASSMLHHQHCRQLSQAQMMHATEAERNLAPWEERQSRRGPRRGEMRRGEMGRLIGHSHLTLCPFAIHHRPLPFVCLVAEASSSSSSKPFHLSVAFRPSISIFPTAL